MPAPLFLQDYKENHKLGIWAREFAPLHPPSGVAA